MLRAQYEKADDRKFDEDCAMAEKLEETKHVRDIEVKLGFNAYHGTPKRIWYTIAILALRGMYQADFGTDYNKAKAFYDNIDWFAELLAVGQEIRDKLNASEPKTWQEIATNAGGKDIEVPRRF